MSLHTGSPGQLRLFRVRRGVRLTLARFRPLVVAAVAAIAVATLVPVLRPEPEATVAVLVAAHDLAAGSRLGQDDVSEVRWPVGARPDGALDRAVLKSGVLASTMRRGEPLTDARVLGPGLLTGAGADVVAAPVRIADASAAGLVRVGDVVDLYLVSDPQSFDAAVAPSGATDPSGSARSPGSPGWGARTSADGAALATEVRVLAKLGGPGSGEQDPLPGGGSLLGGGDAAAGALLVVAATSRTAARLAASSGSAIALVLRGNA